MRIILLILLTIVSLRTFAQSNLQNTINDISKELASINQEIIDDYQAKYNENQKSPANIQVQQYDNTIQVKIPMATITQSRYDSQYTNNDAKNPKKNSKENKDIYEIIINKMYALKKKYNNNPYIKITGFDINVGIPPSVTISLEFK